MRDAYCEAVSIVNISRILLFLSLAVYSIALIVIEWQTSQQIVRQFFTDIEGNVFFYAINTSLSVFLLWATALLFGVCLLCIDKVQQRQDYFFYLSQVIMFTYLGFDERFLIHEQMGHWLGRNDAYLLLGLGLVEIGLLVLLGNIRQRTLAARYFLYTAAIFFAVMVVIDAKFPSQMVLRLSLEELTKLWADVCLVLFAWEILAQHIKKLKGERGKGKGERRKGKGATNVLGGTNRG
jgi:phosphoglycerol transferase MdoB-like AlkP superfamily enzyme